MAKLSQAVNPFRLYRHSSWGFKMLQLITIHLYSLAVTELAGPVAAVTTIVFFPTGATTHSGFVFCSPLAGL